MNWMRIAPHAPVFKYLVSALRTILEVLGGIDVMEEACYSFVGYLHTVWRCIAAIGVIKSCMTNS